MAQPPQAHEPPRSGRDGQESSPSAPGERCVSGAIGGPATCLGPTLPGTPPKAGASADGAEAPAVYPRRQRHRRTSAAVLIGTVEGSPLLVGIATRLPDDRWLVQILGHAQPTPDCQGYRWTPQIERPQILPSGRRARALLEARGATMISRYSNDHDLEGVA